MMNPKISQAQSDGFLKSIGVQYKHDFGRDNASSAHLLREWLCQRKKHIILVERDPRDQLISSFYEHKYRNQMWGKRTIRGNLTENLPLLISESVSYNERIAFALEQLPCSARNLHIVRYETLVACTECVMEWIHEEIIGAKRDADNAVRMCEFQTLKDMNATGKWGKSIAHEDDSNKFRSGTIGSWNSLVPRMDSMFATRLYLRKQIDRERKYGLFSRMRNGDDCANRAPPGQPSVRGM